MSKIKIGKILLWIIVIGVLAGIVVYYWDNFFKENQLIGAVALLAFLPFIDRVIKAVFKKEDSTHILGVPFRDFITPWIAFWGLSGMVISYKQAQDNDKQQKQQIIKQEQKEIENNYYRYVDNLKYSNEAIRNEAIDNLYKYAYEHSTRYLKSVCDVFCSHICDITNDSTYRKQNNKTPRKDIQNILDRLLRKDGDTLIFAPLRKSLQGTYLYGANFRDAILSNVDFEEATLSKADFKYAKLNDVNFRDAILDDNVSFEESELTNVNFRYNRLTNVIFKKSKINTGRFKFTKLTKVNFDNAHIDVADFGESEMVDVSFLNDTLRSVSFRNASLKKVNFTNAKFYNVDFWTKIKTTKEDVNFKETMFENTAIERIISKNYTTMRTNP